MANVARHRDKIINTTIRLYREKGFAGTGLAEILALSGAPKGSLYYYFPGGKEELTVAAITTAGRVVEKTLRELADQTASPEQFVKAYCNLLAEWMEASRFKAGCPIATTILEAVPQSKAITEASREVFKRWTMLIAGVFQAGGEEVEDSIKAAEQAIALIQGRLLLARVQQSSAPLLA